MLTHTEAMTLTALQLIEIEKLKQRHCAQDQREILKNDQIVNVTEKQYNNFYDEKIDASSEASNTGDEVKMNGNGGGSSGVTSSGKNVDRVEHTEGGALWDIFRRQDAHKLEEYLKKHSKEFRHTYCFPLKQVLTTVFSVPF